MATTTRRSALVAGVLLLVAFPLWWVFDLLLLPERARSFGVVRAGCEVLILAALAAVASHRIGVRWPAASAFVLMLLPEIAIAWMIPRSEPQLEPYLLGFSLTIFGSAVVLVWRWQYTAALLALTLSATLAFSLLADPGLEPAALATTFFYLGTAGAVGIAGQILRYRLRFEQFVTERALIEERARSEALVDELQRLSGEDSLTGLPNRRAWQDWASKAVARYHRSGAPFSLVLCDVDHFKVINDSRGHAAGDLVLQATAAILLSRVRNTDFVARLGGDEFVIGCSDSELDAAHRLAEALAARAHHYRWPEGLRVTMSFGVATLDGADDSLDDLVRRADAALYRAKEWRDSVVVDAPRYDG